MEIQKLSKTYSKQAKAPSGDWNRFQQKFTFGLIAAVFIALTVWSWRKWPDILVDFGQQLYIPWQLASGQRLYTDIVFLHGPFSQHFNAIWFYLFGPSLTVLVYVNLGILACTTAIIYKIIRLFADWLTAAACAIIFLSVFGFAQYVGIGNYNWITPYTHEATHGVALIAAFILLWSRLIIKYKRSVCALSGLCIGLALLTKLDTALAAIAVASAGVIAAFFLQTKESKFRIADALLFGVMIALPATCFFIYFLTYMPIEGALAAAFAGLSIVPIEVSKNIFFLRNMGLDDVGGNLTKMAFMGSLLSGLIFIAAMVDVFSRRWLRHPLLLSVPLASAIFVILLGWPDLFPWTEITRALLPATLLALIVFIVLFFKTPRGNQLRLRLLPMILWAVLALTLLTKIMMNVHFANYGFYLAMPAALVVVTCLLYWIPQELKARYHSGFVFRWLVVAVLATGVVHYLKVSNHFYNLKDFPIGKGGDMFMTYRPERVFPVTVMDSAMQWIEEKTPPFATVTALPEGIMFNYLTRRTTSLPVINFMMAELVIFGEVRILDDFKARPPEYVLLVHNDTTEFGLGPFGVDPKNGRQIMQWVNHNYTPVALIGAEPFQSKVFGIKILKRNRQLTAEGSRP